VDTAAAKFDEEEHVQPVQQRRGPIDGGLPAGAREEPAGRREEEPVGPRHHRTAGPPPEDGEFVPKHDDLMSPYLPAARDAVSMFFIA
jgi:hypothetical protein